jgi:hypothetical protein
VYFNIRNTLPKSGTFLLGHPVYITCENYINFFILNLLYERKTYQINGKWEYNIELHFEPRFYDADWIQQVYELSHVVKAEVQVTHSDNYDYYY